ncbi:hypothetical protein CN163_33140 [Sinorhizobium meliloti]|nr:hypothetical protein CN163_33140 [Sinorhizobium meliloti]
MRNFKKLPRSSGANRGRSRQGRRVEIWFQDEARIGQKNKITRLWAKPHDQRTRSAYIFEGKPLADVISVVMNQAGTFRQLATAK